MQPTRPWQTMQASFSDRSNRAQDIVATLLLVAALVVLALVLARLTWAWLAPEPEPVAQAAVETGLRLDVAPSVFGIAARQSSVAAPTGIAITLLGVVTATPGYRGYALLQLDGKQILAVRQGDAIAPGVDLAEVGAGRIILERGGVRETLALPEKSSASAPATLPVQ